MDKAVHVKGMTQRHDFEVRKSAKVPTKDARFVKMLTERNFSW